ncbi:acid protease, partial [Trametes sanguinea]
MKLHQLVRPDKYKGGKRPSFAAAYARAARRYGFETGRNAGFAKRNNVVVKVKGKHDKDTEHEVPAESIQNGSLEYVVPVKIGTPGVTLNLDFDTGSSDLWVWSSELARSTSKKGHTIYDPTKSSTAKKASGTWNISYGDGSSASGNVYTDDVTVADIVIKSQAVELAEKLSASFLQDNGNDGLLGLAWPQINTVQPEPVATPVENMMKQNLINPPVFTVKLGRGDEAGFYSFGFIDTSVTPNPITYTPVDNSQGFWQVQSTSWTLNGETKERSGNTTILDTGTTLCLVADDVVDAIYGAIPGAVFDDQQGGYKFPSDATIPEVAFAVGDTLYKLNPKDFAFGDAGSGFTFGGVQSRGDLDFDIFGDVFLKSVYVVFNQGEKTVGLAQRND